MDTDSAIPLLLKVKNSATRMSGYYIDLKVPRST